MAISKKIKTALEGASWIRRMFEEGEELRRRYGAEKVFDFSLGNPDLEPPAEFKNALKELAEHPVSGMHRYMPNVGYSDTRAMIAQYLSEDTGLPFKESQIVMTVGAAGGLNVVFKALLDPEDEVVVPSPYFVEYRSYAENHGGKIRIAETNDDFSLNLDQIEKAIGERSKIVLINSPHNPTGVVYSRESIEKLGELLKKKSAELTRTLFLVTDDPYRRILYDGVELPDPFRCYPHTLRITSHSKDLSLAGERIGYIAVSPLCEDLDEMMSALAFSNRVLGFVNAPALMQRLVGSLQRSSINLLEYEQRRDLFYNALKSYGYDVVKPQGAFYLFPKAPGGDDVGFVRELQSKRILVVPGRGFGRQGYFRIAYAVERKTIEGALPGFKEAAEKFGLKGK
jgi:aspartate aminotransferase